MLPLQPVAASRAGLSRAGLYRAADAGDLVRIARGIYLPAQQSASDWDLIEAVTRRPDATICLTSALSYYDLIDTIPSTLDMAIPRGSRSPATEQAITWHQFAQPTFDLGRSTMPIEGSKLTIGIYSPERCIADAFRMRGQLGYETARDALKEWLRRGGKPNRIIEIGLQLPRTRTPLMHALETLT
ncbi:MAG: type IV toxin-antitoxin system AbiEi family antitoxin domain-containing protein [Bowdeniella nasicola]|nr:type IV toxin-antitoxin system AbiEi family antitoxin domain-containing protein [Bowdeniella nasicola]